MYSKRCFAVGGYITRKALLTDLSVNAPFTFRLAKRVNSRNYNSVVAEESLPNYLNSQELRSRRPLRRNMIDMKKAGVPIWLLKNTFLILKSVDPLQLPIDVKLKPPAFEFTFANNMWTCELLLFYPREVKFEGKSTVKKRAEDAACAAAINWLVDERVISKNYNPIIKRPNDMDSKLDLPLEIKDFNPEVKSELNNFLDKFSDELLVLMEGEANNEMSVDVVSENIEEGMAVEEQEVQEKVDEEEDDWSSNSEVFDVVTGKILEESTTFRMSLRSSKLFNHLKARKDKLRTNTEYQNFRTTVESLPIYNSKAEIIDAIENNRVTVISGETACGKTTQIPLFMFEHYIEKGIGAKCSMVITQPRRLPAITVAEQVAYQFGEDIGESIGYQIRFNKQPPKYRDGGILFCTSGILLRKLMNNPDLLGVSHVFIDEVHERDVVIDFLLVLMKRLLKNNPNIKVILMSATINARLFSEFFDNCPVIEVKGRLFPVKQYYLPEIAEEMRLNQYPKSSLSTNRINKNLIADIIMHIDRTKEEGAILCFLPGWAEIEDVRKELEARSGQSYNPLSIIRVHSQLPYDQQKLIFQRPPQGVRKVVLSTNIAETSITVPDVVHVVDPGLCKEIQYDKRLNVSAFGTHWISRANAKQREGRAGRVKAGNCFKLYTPETEDLMDDYSTPELLRIPLESVVIQSKYYCPSEKVEEFLSNVPQPPSTSAVASAVSALKLINVLDDNENLTKLGNKIVHFTIHPRLAVSLIYASMFGCLDAMLNVVSAMSGNRDIFQVPMDQKALIKEVKAKFADNYNSDHYAFSNILKSYERNSSFASSFCDENYLHRHTMASAIDIKRMCEMDVNRGNLLDVRHSFKASKSKNLLEAALISGLYPNIIRIMFGEVVNGKMKRKNSFVDVKSGQKIVGSSDCVFNWMSGSKKLHEIGQFIAFAIYFNSYYSIDSRRLTVKDATLLSPLSVLLFSGKKWLETNCGDDHVVITVDDNSLLKYKINREEAMLVKKWKIVLSQYFKWFLSRNDFEKQNHPKTETVTQSLDTFLTLTEKLLNSYSDESN